MRMPRVRLEAQRMIVAVALAVWSTFEVSCARRAERVSAAEDESRPTAEAVA